MPRKVLLWSVGGLGVALVAGLLAVRFLLVFGPDGPPPEDRTAYTATARPSHVQTEIGVPLDRVEQVLQAGLSGVNPFFEGRADRIGIDIVMALLGMERRTKTECHVNEFADVGRRRRECLDRANKLSGWARQLTAKAACEAKFLGDGVETSVATAGKCVEQVVPVPLPSETMAVEYAFSIASVDLSHDRGRLRVEADIASTLTVPSSALSFLDGERTKACGPSLSATAHLTPTLTADNSDRTRQIGSLRIGFAAEDIVISPGTPCKALPAGVQTTIDGMMANVMRALSDAFQNVLVDALEGVADNEALAGGANGALEEVVAPLTVPIALRPLIEAQRPGVLPAGLNPFLTLNPEEIVLPPPGITAGGSSGVLMLSPGIVARPVVTVGGAPETGAGFIALDTRRPASDRFSVAVVGAVDLAAVEAVATDQVAAAIEAALGDVSYDAVYVTLYQARERLVVGVEVSGVTWLGLTAQVFLTARPEVEAATRTVRLRDVKFDVDSENFLLRFAAFVLESPLEDTLEAKVALPLGPSLDGLLQGLGDLSVTLDADTLPADMAPAGVDGASAVLTLALRALDLEQLWVSDGRLNAAVLASGTSRASVH